MPTPTVPNLIGGELLAAETDSYDDVFNGTHWIDIAGLANPPGPVTDNSLGSGESPLVIEDALSKLRGIDPNGGWTLDVTDNVGGDSGTFRRWAIEDTVIMDCLTSTTPSTC